MKTSSSNVDQNDASQSFIKIYKENYQWLSNWLFRNLKSRTHLEDLVQDTFLKLFSSNNAHLLREPKAYLATTARGLFIDHTRHEIIERKYLAYLKEHCDLATPYSPEEIISHLQVLHCIATAISDLPERQRMCLLLYYLEGNNQSEIAQRFGVTTRTVQHDLVKAMVHCHVWIQNQT